MTVQINFDKTLKGEKRSADFFTSQISEALERYESQITRIEVHLKDENGKKDGINDISCLLEARLEGMNPIVASHKADTVDQAISGAIAKIKATIKTIRGRKQRH